MTWTSPLADLRMQDPCDLGKRISSTPLLAYAHAAKNSCPRAWVAIGCLLKIVFMPHGFKVTIVLTAMSMMHHMKSSYEELSINQEVLTAWMHSWHVNVLNVRQGP